MIRDPLTQARDRIAKLEADNAALRAYVGDNQFKSDFKTADDMRATITALRNQLDNAKAALKNICDEWSVKNGAVCDPNCDGYGHSDTCKAASIAEYLKALREAAKNTEAIVVDAIGFVVGQHLAGVSLLQVSPENKQWHCRCVRFLTDSIIHTIKERLAAVEKIRKEIA